MDINKAKEIIATLAEGIDPTTGEILPDNSVINKGEVICAFYTILTHLDEKKAKKNMTENKVFSIMFSERNSKIRKII